MINFGGEEPALLVDARAHHGMWSFRSLCVDSAIIHNSVVEPVDRACGEPYDTIGEAIKQSTLDATL